MFTDLRIINFAKTEKINVDLYSSYEIRIKASINLGTNAVFKLVSTAFNNKGYRINVSVTAPETTVKVMFTYPGKDQEIKLIPLYNCLTGRECIVKVDVNGKRKDLDDFAIDDNAEKKLTIPCNLSRIVVTCLRSGRQSNDFVIEKIVKNRYIQGELEKLSSAREELSHELMQGLSIYNSAYYTLDFNKNPFKAYELLTAFKTVESEWDVKQEQIQKKFAFLEECIRRKAYSFFLNDNSVIQLIAGTREEKDTQHLTEIQIVSQGEYFCKSHPLVTAKEYRSDNISEQNNVFSECNSNAKFNVYQCYSFPDFSKSTSNISENKLTEQIIRMLKEFKNKYKDHNVYAIEITSCGFPDVIKNLTEKPVSNLISTIHVYPSDEYAFLFESLAKNQVNIKTMIYDKKKIKFYIEESPFSAINEKKQENISSTEKVNYSENYLMYPNINISNLSRANKEDNSTIRTEKSFYNINDYYQCLNGQRLSEVNAAKVALYRNGKAYSDLDKYSAFTKYVTSLKQKLQTAFLNLINICYSKNYSLDISVDTMSGAFLEQWGMKEYLNNTVFHWKKILSNMDIFRYSLKSEYASFWGNGGNLFKGIVSIFAAGALTHVDDYEKTVLDSSFRYYKKKSEGTLDIRLHSVLCNDNAISAGSVKRHGIEGELERSFQIEENGGEIKYSINFPGIAAEIEHKVPVLKTSVYEKSFVRDYIGGALIEKSIFPYFHFAPWLSLQSEYEAAYGKLLKLSNILKETVFYLYHIQNQALNSRIWYGENSAQEIHALEKWKTNLKHPEFDVNGMLVRAQLKREATGNTLSPENKQWSLLLDGVNRKIITDTPSSPLLKKVHQYLKTCDENFILEEHEDLKVGQDIFYFVLIIMAITDFIEAKQVKLSSVMDSLEMEHKNMTELFNKETLKESAESYDKMETTAKSKFDSFCKEFDISGVKNAFSPLEVQDIKNFLSKLNFVDNIDFADLEKFCSFISFVSELLENCINSRSYWLTGINRPMKVKPIFELQL